MVLTPFKTGRGPTLSSTDCFFGHFHVSCMSVGKGGRRMVDQYIATKSVGFLCLWLWLSMFLFELSLCCQTCLVLTLIYMEFAVVGADVDFSSSTSSMYHSIIMWSFWSSQWDFCCASSWSRCHYVFVTEVHVFLIVIIFKLCCCYCRCCCRCHWWRQWWWWCYVVVVAVVHIYYPVMLGDRFGARDDVFPTK